ncbi:hypothetical protein [Candidatus Enterococcus leclercqii]|uniref:hypothetical protein n=1 Tax=Candidatus Enterococcus leclercqii TaxID=1857218 RepID=UPI0013794A4C|nr:hypothetical protein [Enterococcus sp. CU9D]KAF1292814.1 hypothetical protein BAU14_10215 [Enterococcus sp. CU9D]
MTKESKNLVDLISQAGSMGMDYLLENKSKQGDIRYSGLALCDVLLGAMAVFLPTFITTKGAGAAKPAIGLYTVLPENVDLMGSNLFFGAFLIIHIGLFLHHFRRNRQRLALHLNALAIVGLLLVMLVPAIHVISGLLLVGNAVSCVYCGYRLKKLAQEKYRKEINVHREFS